MSAHVTFNEAKPLVYFMEHLSELPTWSWLYVDTNTLQITLDTMCHPKAMSSWDMSEEENDDFDAHAELAGLKCFFCRDQLEEIRSNLMEQTPCFTLQQLASAIDFYWTNDAFIDYPASAV